MTYEEACAAAERAAKPLLEAYLANPPTSVREQALAELSIWGMVPTEGRTAILVEDRYYAKWMARCLGGPSSLYNAKARLIKQDQDGVDVRQVWRYLESPDAKPSVVLEALTFAKKRSQDEAGKINKTAFTEAVLLFLEDPVARPSRSHRSSKRSEGKRSNPLASDIVEEEEKRRKSLDAILTDGAPEVTRKLWSELQDAVKATLRPFLLQRLDGFESALDTEQRLTGFCVDVRSNFDDLLLNIRRLRATTGGKEVIEERRQEIKRALEVLRIDPQRGWTKDKLDVSAIKSSYRQLAKQFHPDLNNDPRYLSRYHEIQESYRLLKQYLNM